MVHPVVKMLEVHDDDVRNTAAGLLVEFALHSGSLFRLILRVILTTILDDVRTSILESGVIRPVVKMLGAHDDGVRNTAAGLLREFALHSGSLFCSVLLLISTAVQMMFEPHFSSPV